jgi:hypothetical protein
MERVESVVWQFVGGAVVVLILLAITIHSTVGWSPVGAAWVQAVGSVLALFITGGVVGWEVRQRRLDMGRLVAERLLARVAIVELVAKRVTAYAEHLNQVSLGASDSNDKSRFSLLQYALTHAKKVEVGEMPTSKCVEALTNCRLVIDVFDLNALLSNAMDHAIRGGDEHVETMQTIEAALTRLEESISILKEEAERLST